jgi:hypothetical protein
MKLLTVQLSLVISIKMYFAHVINRKTERCSLVVNTPASYLGGLGFKFRSDTDNPDLSLSWLSSALSGKFRDSNLN